MSECKVIRPHDPSELALVTRVLAGGSAEAIFDGGSTPTDSDRGERFGILPNAARPRLLVPLSSRAAAAASVGLLNPMTRWHRLGRTLLRLGFRTGVARVFCHDTVTIDTARAPNARGSTVPTLTSNLERIFHPQEPHIATLLSNRGDSGKPVFQVCSSAGRILGYGKIGWNERTRDLIQHEADVLGTLRRARFTAGELPGVIATFGSGDNLIVVQRPPPPGTKIGSRRWTADHVRFLADLHAVRSAPGTGSDLSGHPFWDTIGGRLRRLRELERWRSESGLLDRGLRHVAAATRDRPPPFGWGHGDFAPWNTKSTPDGIYVFDWEYAFSSAPAGWDLLHFFIQRGVLLDGWSPADGYRELTAGAGARWLHRYLHAIGASPAWARTLLLLYLIDSLLYRIVDRPGAGSLADRQRDFRAELLALILKDRELPGPVGT